MHVSAGRRKEQAVTPTVSIDPLIHQEAGPEPTWRDSFVSSVGMTVDEGLSISESLNRELEKERWDIFTAWRDEAGEDAVQPYRVDSGGIDWDRLVKEQQIPGMLENTTIARQRNDMLAKRRAGAEWEMSNSWTASMAGGMAAGAGLDPLVALTMPLGVPASGIRAGMTAMQIAGRVAAAEAAIGVATEIPIQALIYSHKQEIGSPYNRMDVFAGLAGAAVFSGAVGGIAGYLGATMRNAAAARRDNPDMEVDEAAIRDMETVQAELEANTRRPSREASTAAITRMAARTSDELEEIVAPYRAAPESLEKLSEDEWLDVNAAEGLLARRAEVERRAPADFEERTIDPVEGELPTGPARTAEVRKMDDPVVLTKLRKLSDELGTKIDKIAARIAKAESTSKGSPRQLKKDTKADRAELAKLEKEKARADADVARAEEAQVGAARAEEKARIERLVEADQEFIDELYNDGLVEADIRYLRQQQADYDKLNKGRPIAKIGEGAVEVGDRQITEAAVDESVIGAVMSDDPPLEMRQTADEIERLKMAEGCYV
jgi:hypothetical protein